MLSQVRTRIRIRPTIVESNIRFLSTNERIFRENDVVLIRPIIDPEKTILTKPLNPGQTIQTHYGVIKHEDIISKSVRQIVLSSKALGFRLHWPTTDEYVTKVRRLVTPIYPQDAATIVSLLDIHVSTPPHPDDSSSRPPPLEILEAGTGHGSLTIALAKAIHAANPSPAPQASSPSPASEPSTPSTDTSSPSIQQASNPDENPTVDNRNAIIHTLDINSAHSKHAKKVIAGFRRGMYLPHIDFHIGTPTSFLKSQFAVRSPTSTPIPFLNIILLDLPSPESYLKISEEAMHPDGMLGLFCPSITQIAEVVKIIKEQRLQFFLERCVEFSNNGGVKSWDVRVVKVRDQQNSAAGGTSGEGAEGGTGIGENLKMVCRPKVGETIIGGGFFAVFRRLEIAQVKQDKDVKGKDEALVEPVETDV